MCTLQYPMPKGWKYTQNFIEQPGSDWSNSQY